MLKKIIPIVFLAIGIFTPRASDAREYVTDWYIKDFNSKITVNKDSTLDITEDITADCGNAPGKHGIFRILPERLNLDNGKTINTPVELLSISDFNGRELKFSENKDFFNHTVIWKIGDPDKEVRGVNHYRIHYRVKNVIRFDNGNFDELYWNLNGNFWELETDSFQASIIFPFEVTKDNSQVEYYSGQLGSKNKDLAAFSWAAPNVLEFFSTRTLEAKEGITASITFPKGIFTPYRLNFYEYFGERLWLSLPFFVFLICFQIWRKYGKDPKMDKTVIPEYEVPGKMTPLEVGALISNGWRKSDITAEIIFLATKGIISIKETKSKVLVFSSKDYELVKNPDAGTQNLTEAEKEILDNIFSNGDTVKLSALKNNFYQCLGAVGKKNEKLLKDKGLIVTAGLRLKTIFISLGAVFIAASIVWSFSVSIFLGAGVFISGAIIFIFAFLMPKRTPAGAELNWQIKGFKLFMETVDKYRAEFYEKENIFEKFLPYAIVFGITGLWIKKMKEIYGEDFYRNYAIGWYVGSLGSFDADSFTKSIDSLSSAIASSTSSPSGSGGAGGAGGGGGGGGGGGW